MPRVQFYSNSFLWNIFISLTLPGLPEVYNATYQSIKSTTLHGKKDTVINITTLTSVDLQ